MFTTRSVLAHHQQCTRWPVYHVAVPAPRSHVSKCSILVARGPGGLLPGCCCFQPAASSHTTNTHTPARVRIHSTLGLTIIANDQSLRFSLSCRASRAVPTTRESHIASTRAVFLFFFRVPTLFLAGRSFFLFASRCAGRSFFLLASRCAARHARPRAKTHSLARTPMTDGRTTRRAVRRHG